MGGWGRRDRIASGRLMAANLAGLEGTRSGASPPGTEQDFRLFLLLSGNRPAALKRAQLDHLCTHTLKGS
jgi:hypothetical protein